MPSRELMQLTTRRVYSSGTAPSNVAPASRTPVAQPARSSSRSRTASAGVGPEPADTPAANKLVECIHLLPRCGEREHRLELVLGSPVLLGVQRPRRGAEALVLPLGLGQMGQRQAVGWFKSRPSETVQCEACRCLHGLSGRMARAVAQEHARSASVRPRGREHSPRLDRTPGAPSGALNTPHAARESVARWGTTGRPPAGMIDAMTKHLIRRLRAVQEVAAQ